MPQSRARLVLIYVALVMVSASAPHVFIPQYWDVLPPIVTWFIYGKEALCVYAGMAAGQFIYGGNRNARTDSH